MHPALLSASYRNAVMALRPRGYWRLSEGSGTFARDETGQNHGTYTGSPTLGSLGMLAGDPNTGMTPATGKYVSTFAAPISPVVTTRTVLAWILPSGTTRGGIMGTRSSGVSDGWVFTAHLGVAGNLTYFHTTGITLTLAAGLSAGNIYMVAATVNTVSGIGELWSNAVSLGTTGSFAAEPGPSFNGVIGDEDGGFTTPFVGTVAQPATFDRVLTQAEQANLYRIGRGF